MDNNAIADGFQIYLHTFVVTADGEWAVVQQGLNEARRTARRYHWHSASVRDFTTSPHTAIVGEHAGRDSEPGGSRRDGRPGRDACAGARESRSGACGRCDTWSFLIIMTSAPHNVDAKRLGAVLAVAHERDLRDFASLLLVEQLGPRTLQSLALVAEVIHGTPTRFADPARFSFAHGGKDGHPFPVPLHTYDDTIAVLRRSLDRARVDALEKRDGLKRLDRFVTAVESHLAPRADVGAAIARERQISKEFGGRTVFDDAGRRPRQQTLF